MQKEFISQEKDTNLFRCTHYKTGKDFWVFDKTDALMDDVRAWKAEHKKKVSEDVIE